MIDNETGKLTIFGDGVLLFISYLYLLSLGIASCIVVRISSYLGLIGAIIGGTLAFKAYNVPCIINVIKSYTTFNLEESSSPVTFFIFWILLEILPGFSVGAILGKITNICMSILESNQLKL